MRRASARPFISRYRAVIPAIAAVLLSLLLASPPARAQEAQPGSGTERNGASAAPVLDLNHIDPSRFHAMAARVAEGRAPKIDGTLDDEAWAGAPVTGQFYQREPKPGHVSSERTEFRILYDDRKIYFGIWAFDSDPSGIRATEMKRDSGLNKGDRIAIVLDTFHDRRNGFYFATNPLGAYKDAEYTDNARVRNNDWNAVWECRTSIDDKGWYVEIAVPLSQLRFDRKIGETTWGLNVARSIVRKNEETYWVPYPRIQAANGFAYLSNAGTLDGLKDLRAPRRLELVPFVAPQAGRDYDSHRSLDKADRYGFDARVGLTNTLMADFTYRTDFAQVEADQEVVNVTRFSLFFPEKRQFFTESSNLFNYGKPGVETGDFGPGLLPLFYTRRVGLYEGNEVPILAGGRLTGHVGPYSLGLMNIETDHVVVGSGASRKDFGRGNYTVARVRRDIFRHSSVGAILLNREGGPGASFNRTVGFDLNLVFANDVRVTTLLARSFSPERSERNPGVPERRGGSRELAFGVDVAQQKDKYAFDLTYLDVGEAFNAEMGYIQRTDIRRQRAKGAWTPRPRWKGVRQVSLGGSIEAYETHAGVTASRNGSAEFGFTFNDTSTLFVEASRDYDLLDAPFKLGSSAVPAGGHWWNTARVSYSSTPRGRVAGSGYVETGGYYNGDKTTVSGGVAITPKDTLLLELNYNRNHITLPNAPAYDTNTLSTRVSYSFKPTLFAKVFAQYNNDRKLGSLNLLLWNIYRPGSDFYIVYNQQWNTDLPGQRFLQRKNRTLSVKLTYWLSR